MVWCCEVLKLNRTFPEWILIFVQWKWQDGLLDFHFTSWTHTRPFTATLNCYFFISSGSLPLPVLSAVFLGYISVRVIRESQTEKHERSTTEAESFIKWLVPGKWNSYHNLFCRMSFLEIRIYCLNLSLCPTLPFMSHNISMVWGILSRLPCRDCVICHSINMIFTWFSSGRVQQSCPWHDARWQNHVCHVTMPYLSTRTTRVSGLTFNVRNVTIHYWFLLSNI